MFRLTDRTIIIKEIFLLVRFTLVKPNLIQKLDGMSIMSQLKVQNHRNTFKAISKQYITSNASKTVATSKNVEALYIALY